MRLLKMTNYEALSNLLKQLSLSASSLEHSEMANLAEWASSLKSKGALPVKTLLLKSKSTPLLLVSLESTPYSIGPLSKALGAKDARVAADDVVQSLFGVNKLDCTKYCINLDSDSLCSCCSSRHVLSVGCCRSPALYPTTSHAWIQSLFFLQIFPSASL